MLLLSCLCEPCIECLLEVEHTPSLPGRWVYPGGESVTRVPCSAVQSDRIWIGIERHKWGSIKANTSIFLLFGNYGKSEMEKHESGLWRHCCCCISYI